MATQKEIILQVSGGSDGKHFVYLPKKNCSHLKKGDYVIIQKLGYRLGVSPKNLYKEAENE